MAGMLKVVIISIVLAALGALFIVYNPYDPAMKGFGWFLIAVGSALAVVFIFLWTRNQAEEAEREAERRKGQRRRR